MKEVLRSNDLVRLSWAEALLNDHGIQAVVADVHASAVEGSISAIPRRLMAPTDDHERALALIARHDPDNAGG